MSNNDIFKGKWKEIKGDVLSKIAERLSEWVGRFDAPKDRGTEDVHRPNASTFENLKYDLFNR